MSVLLLRVEAQVPGIKLLIVVLMTSGECQAEAD
ncbi:unnamed protein product [Tetraodon nigroviridis]|uniref:(spotted green pufferfish) hypothetical protein n=1 Tax=Tetraodon nigroviridis TaxID=99883 RepID=Q4SGN4_TETNG|nr:unnamed protein product [Tetraodon nigroviridis]